MAADYRQAIASLDSQDATLKLSAQLSSELTVTSTADAVSDATSARSRSAAPASQHVVRPELLSNEDIQRFARQIIIPEFGCDGQAALYRSKVLVIGAGALGSPSITYLAAAGIGTLGIVDGDSVELSNLHRQIFHAGGIARPAKIGWNKGISAADAVKG